MINSIIFDMDDVIINSSGLHFQAYEKALRHFGLAIPELPADLKRDIYGMRIKEIMELFVHHFKMDVDVVELTKFRNAYFMELVAKGIEPMPGLYELVENIKEWGFKRAVASSGVRLYVDEVIKKLKLSDFFGAVVTGDDVTNPKPAPDCFLMAARKLGARPSECLVIEDATKGVAAAKSAGMMAVGVINSMIDADQDLSQADFIVDRLDKITLEMLKKAGRRA